MDNIVRQQKFALQNLQQSLALQHSLALQQHAAQNQTQCLAQQSLQQSLAAMQSQHPALQALQSLAQPKFSLPNFPLPSLTDTNLANAQQMAAVLAQHPGAVSFFQQAQRQAAQVLQQQISSDITDSSLRPRVSPHYATTSNTPAQTISSSPYYAPVEESNDDPEEVKRKRLARKAELARMSRQRKKHYINGLEAKVVELAAEVARLEKTGVWTNANGVPASLERLDSQEDIYRTVNANVDKLATAIEPGLQAKFALWGLTQEDSLYEQKNSLWHRLMGDHVGLNESQLQALHACRPNMIDDQRSLTVLRTKVAELRQDLHLQLKKFGELREILTKVLLPEQLTQLNLWVDQNQWVAHLMSSTHC
jgi:hypothetical protein